MGWPIWYLRLIANIQYKKTRILVVRIAGFFMSNFYA
ncbi:protein of unknown function [Moritella yayanosii]|uniref:Uncharacterized protein n=1 Tax=Moritella yayanosii TaxID=69539 RepID=A0A330LWX7_9GAMM|nr:protein of unknown function [Moritella yayanosii]